MQQNIAPSFLNEDDTVSTLAVQAGFQDHAGLYGHV